MLINATLTISTSARGANKAVGAVEREIDRGNYWLRQGHWEEKCSGLCAERIQPVMDRHLDTCTHAYSVYTWIDVLCQQDYARMRGLSGTRPGLDRDWELFGAAKESRSDEMR